MKQPMKFLHKIIINPYFELIIGILLIISGLADLLYEVKYDSEFIVQGHHGIVLLGCVILLKCIAVILFGIICSDKAIQEGKFNKGQYFFSVFHKVVHHWGFDLVLSLTLIITGAAEVFEVFKQQEPVEQSVTVWAFGIVLLGIIHMIKAGTTMFTVFFRISNAIQKFGEDTGSAINLNNKIFNFIRRPQIELLMAIFIILFCILEEVLNTEQQGLSSHHGLLLFGIFQFFRMIPSLVESMEVWKDSIER